jgi:hypothetical protein
MQLQDLMIGPLTLLLVFFLAMVIRPVVTDQRTAKYFYPALMVKVLGAIALGLIYQFYYGGGDTFTYFTSGSKLIWEAFLDSPSLAFKLIFADNKYHPDLFQYSSRIYTYRDPASYFVVRIAGLFGIITLNTYSAVAIWFAAISFSGTWALFQSFYRIKPGLHLEFAAGILFFPSIFFWGSGLLKDSITFSAVGWFIYALFQVLFYRKNEFLQFMILLVSAYVLYVVKIYILLCLLPATIFLIFNLNLYRLKSRLIRALLAPGIILLSLGMGYYSVREVGEENHRYSLDKVLETAESTARWISYVSEREGGSTYTLGDYDYSLRGVVRKLLPAIWVTLFRPYIWEAHNPVMLLSALECTAMLLLTVYVFFRTKGSLIGLSFKHPVIIFCWLFSLTFSFAVGFSTYNFGSLVRYKIPMIPFYLSALLISWYIFEEKRIRKAKNPIHEPA